MKFFNNFVIVIILSIFLSSCVKLNIVELDKDKNVRVISYTSNKSEKTKLVNQKYNFKHNSWFEAKCDEKKIIYFINCPKEKIIFTKIAIMKINLLASKEESSSSKEESSSSKEESSSSEEESSSSEEESSSSEEEDFSENEEPFDPRPPPGECIGGPEVC